MYEYHENLEINLGMPILIRSQREAHDSEEVWIEFEWQLLLLLLAHHVLFCIIIEHVCDSLALEIYSIVLQESQN